MKNRFDQIALCVFLIISLLIIPVSASAEAETLLKLNLDDFKAGAPADTDIKNDGTSKTASINIGSNTNVKVEKVEMINYDGERVSYLHKFHSKYNWSVIGSYMDISDPIWEDKAVTFAFWADLNTVKDSDAGKSVAEYRISYDNNGTAGSATLLLCQLNWESYKNYAWNVGYNTTKQIDMANSKGWSHVVITNPKTDSDGKKTMDVYINGVYKKSKDISIPTGAEITSAKLTFGATSENKMVPSDAQFGDITVYNGVLSRSDIAELYEEQKDMFTPYEGKNSLGVYSASGQEQNGYINYADLQNGMDIKISADNTSMDEDMTVNVYAAVRQGESMKNVEISPDIIVPAGKLGHEISVSAVDVISDVSLGDKIDFYLWTDELTPLTDQKSFYIKDMLVLEDGGCRLIINTGAVPSAAELKPEAFKVSDGIDSYAVSRSIYYPFTHELHLIIDDAAGISAPCRVTADITGVDGKPMTIDTEVGLSSLHNSNAYSDSIKYLVVSRDGKAVGSIYEDDTYNIEVCAILQGESRLAPVDIVVYKKSGDKITEIERKTAGFTENDFLFEISCELECGDKVFAVVE